MTEPHPTLSLILAAVAFAISLGAAVLSFLGWRSEKARESRFRRRYGS